MKIPSDKLINLRRDILQVIKRYSIDLDKDTVRRGDLEIIYLSAFYPEIIDRKSLYEIESSGEYDSQSVKDITDLIFRELLACARLSLIIYDFKYTENIKITKYGIKYLVEEATGNSDALAPDIIEKEMSYDTTTLIHISDLHFGTLKNDGVDLKEQIDTPELGQNIFMRFAKTIEEFRDEQTYLIISGDLTSKNEQKAYSECLTALTKLNIDGEKIYIVPGNHDCDRNLEYPANFGFFTAYFGKYYNPLSKNNLIIDSALKLIIVGLNSVQSGENDLAYIRNEDFTNFEIQMSRLQKAQPDYSKFTKIAVIHHNANPNPGTEVKKFEGILNLFDLKYMLLKYGFRIILSGHKHYSMAERQQIYSKDMQGDVIIISTGSLSSKVSNSRNSFQIIKLKR